MCRVTGIWKPSSSGSVPFIRMRMRDTLTHSGPDDAGVMDDAARLAMATAACPSSIIDLSDTGHKPMSTHDSRYMIVYNSEIYNYHDLSNNKLPGCGNSIQTLSC